MICLLCLEKSENSIDFDDDEGKQLNVVEILRKLFSFCVESEPYHRVVCRKCWWKVDIFNDFYEHIRAIHSSVDENEEIFVTEIRINPKEETDLSPQKIYNNILSRNTDGNDDERDNSWPPNIDPSDENTFNVLENDVLNHSDSKNEVIPLTFHNASSAAKTTKQKQTNFFSVSSLINPNLRRRYEGKIYYPDNGIYRCNQCELTFLTKWSLYCHIKRTHQICEFKCHEYRCVESFTTQQQLDEHTTKYHTQVECSYCHNSMTRFYLSKHIKLYHDESRFVVCDQCGVISSNKGKHEKHILSMHTQKEKLQCDICKSWYASKPSIRAHMSTKHFWKPEKCLICNQIYANRKTLLKHLRIHDDNLKDRFKCTICGKGFRDNCNLKEHSASHRYKEYPCALCNKIYKTVGSWKAHMKKEHTVTNPTLF